MRTYKLHPFRGRNGRYFWHILAPNGNLIASGAQGNGYATRSGAVRAARRLQVIAAAAVVG